MSCETRRHTSSLLLVALEQRRRPWPRRPRAVEVREAGRLLHDLDHRPVRDALAVGQAASPEDRGPVVQPDEELLDQAGLPDARRAQDREELARPVSAVGRFEGLPEHGRAGARARPSASRDRRRRPSGARRTPSSR